MFIWDHFFAGYLNCEKKELCNISLKCCLHCFNDCNKARCSINVTCTCNLFLIIYYSIIFVLMHPYTSFVTLIFFWLKVTMRLFATLISHQKCGVHDCWFIAEFSRAHLMCRSTIKKHVECTSFMHFSEQMLDFDKCSKTIILKKNGIWHL